MGNKDGIAKNLEVVTEGWEKTFEEWSDVPQKVKDADSLPRKLHHLTDYLGAPLQHAWRTWFYTWVPKWAVVAYLITNGWPWA